MKKILITVLVSLFLTTATAQSWFGLKAGANIESYDTDFASSGSQGAYHSHVHWDGFHLGIFGKFKQEYGVWGFQPELLYSYSSYQEYGEIPLNLLWEPFGDSPVGIYVLGGPYGKFQIHRNDCERNVQHKDFQWGIGAGIGLRIQHFQLEWKWNWDSEKWRQDHCYLSASVLF
ncbi:MAG: porin family protein [Candidatus Peribacteria bacterium]|nr:porin family protein [Candidatus Peribacteria bacterium]